MHGPGTLAVFKLCVHLPHDGAIRELTTVLAVVDIQLVGVDRLE
jgi:hypothetical protein